MKMTEERTPFKVLEDLGTDNWAIYGRLVKGVLDKTNGIRAFNDLAEREFSCGCTDREFAEWCSQCQEYIAGRLGLDFHGQPAPKVWHVRYNVRLTKTYDVEASSEASAIAELERRFADGDDEAGDYEDMELVEDSMEAEEAV